MKICVISTTIMTCPPPGYSGLEMVAFNLAKGLAKRGHEILLVAPKGSMTPQGVELHGTTLMESESLAYTGYWNRLAGQDVIISHDWEKWAYRQKIDGQLDVPILGVLHAPAITMYQSAPPVPYPCLVAISKDQADSVSELWGCNARVAYNGIDLDFYQRNNNINRSNRYLFLARMCKIKGPHIAVDIARKLRIGLDLVGDDKLTGEPEYSQRLMAMSRNNIVYHGGVSREKTVEFFSKSKCLLHMNKFFREPFGLAPIESQACEQPVITFNNGAMRETVKHGETGFVVNNESEIIELIKSDAISQISGHNCREWASQFSIDKMVTRYEELCQEAIDTGGW